LLAVVGMAWVVGCEGPTPPEPDLEGLEPVVLGDSVPIVSDPVAGSAVGSLSLASFAPQVGDGDADIVYVSLRPGLVPNGQLVTIRRRGSTNMLTASMEDGGLNPVPIAAADGDTVDVEVQVAGAASVRFSLRVPITRRPRVVRTHPPPKKRDVALNAGIVIVFTEPVARTTLTTSSVQLLKSGTPVAGAVHALEGVTAAAVFEPSAPLDPDTEYQLIVTQGIRDLAGDALETADTVAFATGRTIEGPIASLGVVPDSAEIPVGSQHQLIATARDPDGNVIMGRPVIWASSDPSTATVSPQGMVTAVAEGGVVVTAQVDDRVGVTNLRVSAALAPVAAVAVTPDTGRVFAGRTLEVLAEPRDAAGNLLSLRPITWMSSNPAVAVVGPSVARQRGVVRGIAPGVAKIAANVEGKSDTSVIIVEQGPPVVGFTLSPAVVNLSLHRTARLTAYATAEDGWTGEIDGSLISWSSSDSTVVPVDAVGVLTGRKAGSATITASWSGYTATSQVSVTSLEFVTVSAGYGHACGLTSGGAAYCWGGNSNGALGNGTTNVAFAPVAVAGGLAFTTVTSGGHHGCGLVSSGAAYCWGYNGHGQIGNGSTADALTPVPVSGGLTFTALSAGINHNCGVTPNGVAYCWGQNWDGARGGRLGDGTITSRSTPVPVATELRFTAISAGSDHSCAVATGGGAYCWGANAGGELGNGGGGDATRPVPVGGSLTFSAVSAGYGRSCGRTTSGAAYCWGFAFLGNGTTTGATTPVAVAGGLTFANLSASAGSVYTCGVAAAGIAHCWGSNSYGQLGTGSTTDSTVPVRVTGGLTFAMTSAGWYHACGVTVDAVAYCWGRNDSGELGNGSTTDSPTPVKVAGQP
jgi:alpha-tubulin suppressor-like RCC1 family protein